MKAFLLATSAVAFANGIRPVTNTFCIETDPARESDPSYLRKMALETYWERKLWKQPWEDVQFWVTEYRDGQPRAVREPLFSV